MLHSIQISSIFICQYWLGKSTHNALFQLLTVSSHRSPLRLFTLSPNISATYFFYDNCPGPKVIVGDFSARLTAETLRRHNQSRLEAGMELARDLGDRLIAQGDLHTLQLCS